MTASERRHGGCLCGAVRFRIEGPMRGVVACHCGQCRRSGGNFAAFSACAPEQLTFERRGGLAWFASSRRARRGFCRHCGASLFWQPADDRRIAVAAGALDQPSGLALIAHIHTGDKADWYEIADGARQFAGSMGAWGRP